MKGHKAKSEAEFGEGVEESEVKRLRQSRVKLKRAELKGVKKAKRLKQSRMKLK